MPALGCLHSMPPSLAKFRTSALRSVCLRLALAGFLVRALIPVGFMPAPFGADGPIMICHGGISGAFFQLLDAQSAASQSDATLMRMAEHSPAAHHEKTSAPVGHDEHQVGWDQCPTGVTTSSAAVAHVFSLDLLALSHVCADSEPLFGIAVAPTDSYRARAPPTMPSHRPS